LRIVTISLDIILLCGTLSLVEIRPENSVLAGTSGEENHGSRATGHEPQVLPSVPVDQLLDDHATEFEECKRWANSDAGQAARMTNPAGFANVRAHAEAHLRVMQSMQLGDAAISTLAQSANTK
jgi:hypothetical protein